MWLLGPRGRRNPPKQERPGVVRAYDNALPNLMYEKARKLTVRPLYLLCTYTLHSLGGMSGSLHPRRSLRLHPRRPLHDPRSTTPTVHDTNRSTPPRPTLILLQLNYILIQLTKQTLLLLLQVLQLKIFAVSRRCAARRGAPP